MIIFHHAATVWRADLVTESASTRTLVLAAAGILIVAFIGVMAGNKFLSWRESTNLEQRLEKAEAGQASALRAGQRLPAVDIVGTDGMSTNVLAFTRDGDLILMFVSITCEPCTESVRSFGTAAKQDQVRIIGICEDEVEYAKVYVDKNAIPFAVYTDVNSVFFEEHGISVFPTVIGVRRGGDIAFIKHGADSDFEFEDAVELLRSPAPPSGGN